MQTTISPLNLTLLCLFLAILTRFAIFKVKKSMLLMNLNFKNIYITCPIYYITDLCKHLYIKITGISNPPNGPQCPLSLTFSQYISLSASILLAFHPLSLQYSEFSILPASQPHILPSFPNIYKLQHHSQYPYGIAFCKKYLDIPIDQTVL